MLFTPARKQLFNPAYPPAPFLARTALWKQIAGIVMLATMVAWLSRYWPVGPWNAIIWIVPPLIGALLSNKGTARLVLAVIFPLMFIIVMVANEAAAHLVFGTCLYD